MLSGIDYWPITDMFKFWTFFAMLREIKGNVNGKCAKGMLF